MQSAASASRRPRRNGTREGREGREWKEGRWQWEDGSVVVCGNEGEWEGASERASEHEQRINEWKGQQSFAIGNTKNVPDWHRLLYRTLTENYWWVRKKDLPRRKKKLSDDQDVACFRRSDSSLTFLWCGGVMIHSVNELWIALLPWLSSSFSKRRAVGNGTNVMAARSIHIFRSILLPPSIWSAIAVSIAVSF